MPSGQEIQNALRKFAARWAAYSGTERGEAQTFLNELLDCYGADRRDVGGVFEDSHVADGIVDFHLPGVCIIEMKAPREADRLEQHRPQALRYWHHSDDVATGRAATPYLVLCAFHRFEVWEPGRFPSAPRATFTLEELPDHYESLMFLAGVEQRPLFHAHRAKLTTQATKSVIALYDALRDRDANAPEVLRNFVLQVVWVLFAESLGLVTGRPVERLVEDLLRDPHRSSAAELGQLFHILNEPDSYSRVGVYAGAPYANGGLFAEPARVHLVPDELRMLAAAAGYEWREVDPTIFGSLMEGFLGEQRRSELGAHYTHEVDILNIVRPTIVRPWQERIASAGTPEEAVGVLRDLARFTVLDPACGCGNFLYVAYRELRALEHAAKERVADLAASTGAAPPAEPLPSYPIKNILGLEIDEFAVRIARVTLWMGHKLAADAFGMVERVLPLVDLSGVRAADALFSQWPAADVVIGNPPFLGSQQIRKAHGDGYIERLKQSFGCGVKDYCVYWFRKAHDHLPAGGRAGLVGTNSISQNRARSASLDYIVSRGGVITDAISTQKWPGEAKVHVSIVNWVKQPTTPPTDFTLDGVRVEAITPELRTPERTTGQVAALPANRGRCFQGPIPVGAGFIISHDEARALLASTDANYRDVVRPYLTGDDIAEDPRQAARRWIIDFGLRPLEDASRYPRALAIVRERVLPVRQQNRREYYRRYWWRLREPRTAMRAAIARTRRWAAGARVGKRLLLTWQSTEVCPSDLTIVFALDSDYAMGVLASATHAAWAWTRGSTLKGDLRYTPSTVFETFAWPAPDDQVREEVAAAASAVFDMRSRVCMAEDFGLTTLYNLVDEGAYADLRDAHRRLDEAVVAAYGWERAVARDADEIVRRLLELNREIAAGTRAYEPFPAAATAQQPFLEFGGAP